MATVLRARDYSEHYRTASPFPHVVIDGHFPRARIRDVAAEVRALDIVAMAPVYAQRLKRASKDRSTFGRATAAIIDEMNAPPFIAWLEWLTGIGGLTPDPDLFGGGIHRIERGGFLKVHTDFNWHAGLRLHRRLNLLLYLNEGWQREWGGDLELWQPDMSRCAVKIAPEINRMVIFSTTDESYHGHPDALACPKGVTRNSIALYYYSAEPAPSRFGMSELTNYRARPGERFWSVRHKWQQLRLARGRHHAPGSTR